MNASKYLVKIERDGVDEWDEPYKYRPSASEVIAAMRKDYNMQN